MKRPLRIAIVAGEKSGDNLAAGLIAALQQHHGDVVFEGIGGPAMLALGFESFFNMERLSVMGIVEPLGRLPELLRMKKTVEQRFINNPPDVFIGIDSPAFNLPIETKLRKHGIKTVHYVSPSVWAYGEKRIHKIKRAVDLMLTLFPFETKIYDQYQIPVKFVGHPLGDSIELEEADPLREKARAAARNRLGLAPSDKVLALLPGSRASEVQRLGSVFIEAAQLSQKKYPGLKIVIPCASEQRKLQIEAMLDPKLQEDFILLDSDAQTAMSAANLVLLASGTATLEALLLRRPMVICYKVAALTYFYAGLVLKVPYIGLPNLLAGKALVPEYLQDAVTVETLMTEISRCLNDEINMQPLIHEYDKIHRRIRCNASAEAATAVLSLCARDSGNE